MSARDTKRVNGLNSLDAPNRYRNLKAAFETIGKKLCGAKRTTRRDFCRTDVSSTRSSDIRRWRRRRQRRSPRRAVCVSSARGVFIMQFWIQNFRARKAREMFYLFGGRFKLAARSLSLSLRFGKTEDWLNIPLSRSDKLFHAMRYSLYCTWKCVIPVNKILEFV